MLELILVFSFKFVLFLLIVNMLIFFFLIFLMIDRVLKGFVDFLFVMIILIFFFLCVWYVLNCLYIIFNVLLVYVFLFIYGRFSIFLVNLDVNEYIVRGMVILVLLLNVIMDSWDWFICLVNVLVMLVMNCSFFVKLFLFIKF